MKSILTCLFIILILIPAVALAEVTTKVVKNPDETLTRFFYSDNKEIARETRDRNDNIIKTTGKIPDGVVKEYYASGKLKADYNYKAGKLEGTSKFYYESKLLRAEENYKNGKQEGKYRVYYTTGSLGGEWYYENGKREGMTTLYWENGNTKVERNFKNDKQDGVSKKYYNSGELRYIEMYEMGIKIDRKTYGKNGILILDQNFQ